MGIRRTHSRLNTEYNTGKHEYGHPDRDEEDDFSDASEGSDISDGQCLLFVRDIRWWKQQKFRSWSIVTRHLFQLNYWPRRRRLLDVRFDGHWFSWLWQNNRTKSRLGRRRKYFGIFLSEDSRIFFFFEHIYITTETNRYAEQCGDGDWTGTDSRKIMAYIWINNLIEMNQLPSVDQCWSQNKFIG